MKLSNSKLPKLSDVKKSGIPNNVDGNSLLVEIQLAKRWDCSPKKLQLDRQKGRGPPYIKIGRLVRYRYSDVLDYEDSKRRQNTSQSNISNPQ